jgi:uncharacterized phage protein (TIGR02218 family)
VKLIGVALTAHFAGEYTQPATCWKVTLGDGSIKGFTDHDVDLVIGGLTYLAASGYNATDVETSNAMNVDNLEITSILDAASITAADLYAGLYDAAPIKIFEVNWSDLTQGSYRLRDGNVGQVTTERDQFIAELQGMMDAFKRSVGRLVTPSCPYNLGDFPFPVNIRGRCGVDLTTFTVTRALTGVSDDQQTLFDSARTEPGPGGGVAITGISNANPGVVTTATDLGLPDYATVTISGVVGATWANMVTVIRNPTSTSFELSIDTSDVPSYAAYVGGGTVTPLGADSGYFDYGLITITSGPNTGLRREVKAYIPGQWTLQNAFPYSLVGTETYSMIAGCNKTVPGCQKFNSVGSWTLRFGGFPFVPGQDKAIQVAQPQPAQSQGKK